MGPAEVDATTRGPVVVVWALVGLQLLQVLYFLVTGLGWNGVLHTANVVQGLVLLVVAGFLAVRRRLLVVLVPVLSFVLGLALQGTDAVLTARACSPAARAAVDQLGLSSVVDDGDPFTYLLAFPDGCSTVFGSAEPTPVVLEHHRQAARAAGWELTGQQTGSRAEVSNDRWTVEVEPSRHEPGSFELRVRPRRG